MTKVKEEILRKLRQHTKQEPVIVPAIVKSVDESKNLCIIEINELEFNCRLNAAEDSNKGFLIVPSVNSTILAARLDENGDIYVLHSVSDVDKIYLRNGENGGMVIVSDLITQINKIEDDINSLKQIFTTWVVVPSDGGAALKIAAATWSAQNLIKTTDSDIEDETVLH